ncbi:immunoglobulin-like domain-containing protein [Pleionea sediminis]|uniref:immunoglobulin-like domain-containing protein n=1 Tax=Pleionea sediminis TaxID=2569479 RepID=UPI001185A448|nr:immunoglobulin-like domain-containing protein [Pleionea sediminis]
MLSLTQIARMIIFLIGVLAHSVSHATDYLLDSSISKIKSIEVKDKMRTDNSEEVAVDYEGLLSASEKFLVVTGGARDSAVLLKNSDTPTDANSLEPDQWLNPGESLISSNDKFRLEMQHDGNLVIYDELDNATWASNTDGSGADCFIFQSDGNLVMYASGKAVWSSQTDGKDSSILVLNGNGSLVLYKEDDVVWSAGNTPPTDTSDPQSGVQHIGSTSDYDKRGNINIDVPAYAEAGDLLLLFLSRDNDVLPIQLDGWTAGASCFKSYNEQYQCHAIPDCIDVRGNYCARFDHGHGRDLSTVVFYRTLAVGDDRRYRFDLHGKRTGMAIMSALRGAKNDDPIGDVASESNDHSHDSRFPSVNGNAGDMLMLSMVFDDSTHRNDFRAPDGMERFRWLSGRDEAGYVFGKTLTETGATGELKTRGRGGSRSKDALISLVIKAGADNNSDLISIQRRISNGLDDVEEQYDGYMYTNSSDLEMVYDYGVQNVGLRFTNIDIPNGAIIESATIQFATDETSYCRTELEIHGEAVDSANQFERIYYNLTSRVKTNASVAWNPEPWRHRGESGAKQRTPDLKTIVQEIVDRSGWQSGNNLVFMISGHGERGAESYEGSKRRAPLLEIVYREKALPRDDIPPVLTLIGPRFVNVNAGDTYVDLGATAIDNVDGDISDQIQVSGNVDTSTPGIYALIFSVSDSQGNEAVPVNRVIIVI